MIKVKARVKLIDVKATLKQETDKVFDKAIDDLQAATPVKTGYAQSQWRREGDSIVNDADYIDELNAGSSMQAPAYFIESTMLSQPGIRPSGTIVRSK